jgi:hypothetical protein
VHINGIDTSRDEAKQNLDELQKDVPINSDMTEWDLDYNPTNTGFVNMLSSLWDTMQQKSKERQVIGINDYVNSYMEAHDLHYKPDSPEYNALKSQMLPAYESAFATAAGDNFPVLMTNFIQSFPPPTPNDYSKTEDFFLLIPHSQGNLYANDLWVALTSKYNMTPARVAIFGIASPANSNKGDWIAKALIQAGLKNITSYITSANDFVIGGLNVLYPLLPPNINIPFSSTNPLGHQLISTYLADANSLKQISTMIDMEAYYFLANISNNLYKFQQKYYKFTVQQQVTQTTAAVYKVFPGGDGAIICINGYCNESFDYYIPQNYTQESSVNKIFLFPTTNVELGAAYGTQASNIGNSDSQLIMNFADYVTTYSVQLANNKCDWEPPISGTSVDAYLIAPWNELQLYCPYWIDPHTGMAFSMGASLTNL